MTIPLLSTKLYIPSLRADRVPRPRLIKQLDTGLSKKLTLVSAPAGFGKSTILSDWATNTETDIQLAWLSLDERDSDLARFLSYFIAALQTIDANLGSGLQAALQTHGEMNPEIVLTNLLNEIAQLKDDVVLILDDYHVIESRPIDQAITFLLEHIPPQFHLVISSRIDPTLPLPRLRASDQMTEIRVDDLRFTSDEAVDFLNQAMSFNLTNDDLAALNERTEGWIAGLQLAALSMRGSEDIHEFIRSFTGSNRYILDYLGEEVLTHQPQPIEEFLLRTSILNRLSGPLCDAVCFDKDEKPSDFNSREILESLEATNLFIVPLDHERQWYRYHQLFADLLQYQLKRHQPDMIPTLHRRASEWYENQGIIGEAVFHALAGGAIDKAADLIESNAMTVIAAGEVYTITKWLDQLPEDLIRSKSGLCLAQAWKFYITGQIDKTNQWLDILETQLEFATGSNLREIDVAKLNNRDIWEAMATIRSTIYAWQGKAQPAIEFSRWALEEIPDGNQNYRCILEWNLAFASRLVGNVIAAEKAYLSAIETGHEVGNTLTVLNAIVGLGQLYNVLGQLSKAEKTFLRVFQLGDQYRMPYSVALGSANIGLANVLCQKNKLEAAIEHLKQGFEIAEKWGVLDLVKAYLCQYRINMAQGDLEAALKTIEKAIDLANDLEQDFRGGVARALRTRVWLVQGEIEKADHWALNVFEYDLNNLGELNEIGGITLARVLLAQGKFSESLDLLNKLLSNAQTVQRMGHVIEIRILQALTWQERNDSEQALTFLGEALNMAEPFGFIQIFINEGSAMETLLKKLLADQQTKTKAAIVSNAYIHKLLSAFHTKTQAEFRSPSDDLVEGLTPRELEILQLLALGLSNREISERLFLAINTVKGYNRGIFGKLGVQNRTEAANKARELNLL
jgi:LuxR family maltose regulon positive regulatory protein